MISHITGNVLLNGIFSALSSDIDDLKNDGRRNMEALRLVNAARSLQLLGACDSGSGGYQSDLCTLITADPPTFPFTSYSVSDL